MDRLKTLTPLALILALCLVGGPLLVSSETAVAQEKKGEHKSPLDSVKHLICVIQPTKGNSTKGVVTFRKVEGGVLMIADITGLKAGSKHGFHVHEFGNIAWDNGKSLGGHYNPEGHDHAGPGKAMRHAGDLGNLQADAKGVAHYTKTFKNITLAGHKNPIIGRGIVIHKGEDDLKSQPTGAAGPRIGTGVIGVYQGGP
jgi:Cu-Zn family superoxide dismutase